MYIKPLKQNSLSSITKKQSSLLENTAIVIVKNRHIKKKMNPNKCILI